MHQKEKKLQISGVDSALCYSLHKKIKYPMSQDMARMER